jgi:tetratricopeptide (TPR) repeat protein
MKYKLNRKSFWLLFVPILFFAAPTLCSRVYWVVLGGVAPYRYPIQGAPDLLVHITEMEKRVARDSHGALDRAILASLYAAEAKRSGNIKSYDRAEKLAKESLMLLPFSNPSAKMTLARVAEARHHFEEAIRIAKEIEQEGKPNEAAALLVTSKLALGELTEANALSEMLVISRPSLSNYALRALSLSAIGRDKEAEEAFSAGFRLEDYGEQQESAWVRCLLARLYLKQGKTFAADRLLGEALRIFPSYHLALDLRGQVKLETGDSKGAAKFFGDAFTASRQIIYLRHWSEALTSQGERETGERLRSEAERLMREELAGGEYGHRLEIAWLLIDAGRPETLREAITYASEEYRLRPSAPTGFVLASALAMSRRWQDAAPVLNSVLQTGVKDARYYDLAARIYQGLGNPERAGHFRDLAKGYLVPFGTRH